MAMKFTVVAHKSSNESPAYVATHSTFEEAWQDAANQRYLNIVIEIRVGDYVWELSQDKLEYRPLLRPTEQMHEMLRAQPEAATDAGAWG